MHPLIHVFLADGKREERVSRKLEMNPADPLKFYYRFLSFCV